MKIDPNWPTVDKNVIQKKVSNIVIQINGKKRGIINLTNEVSESELIIKIKNNPLINKFINNEENHIPHLIKIAIAHYQFETIHPFLDGNGRLGRLLITLYLVSNDVLKKPSLYLSDFFEKNKGYYYDNLMTVRLTSNLTQWVKFFLVGVIETSKESIQVFKDIIKLKNNIETERLPKLGSKIENGQLLMKQLFQIPITDSKQVSDLLNISASTANRLIKDLIDLGILSELTGYKRNRKFMFKEYFKIFNTEIKN